MASLLQINQARGGDAPAPRTPTFIHGRTGNPLADNLSALGSRPLVDDAGPTQPNVPGTVPNWAVGPLAPNANIPGASNGHLAPKPPTDYASLYEQSLQASRANIEHQIGSALAAINAQNAGARQAVGTLPGSLNTIYDTGNAGLAQDASSLDAAQKAAGLQSYMGAGAQLAPIHAAVGADLAARQADVPLLNIGIAQQAAAQHAAVEQQRLAMYADLHNQQQSFLAQQAQQQAGFAHDTASETHQANLALRNSLATAQGTPDPYEKASLMAEQRTIDKAGFGGEFTAPEARALRQTPQYEFIAKNGLAAAQDYNRLHPNDPRVHTLFQVLKADGKLPMSA